MDNHRSMRAAILFAVVIAVPTPMAAQRADDRVATPIGCYRSTPGLTYSASGAPERGDSSWSILQLHEGGTAGRPLLSKGRDARSQWRLAGDTLRVVLSDGLAGWRLALTRTSAGWIGVGTYLTDVVVAGGYEPPRVRFLLVRQPCAEAA